MKKPSDANRYDGLLEPWKVQLIISRATRLGFRRHDLEDVQQDVALAIIDFRFDPGQNVAESTVLTALVDKVEGRVTVGQGADTVDVAEELDSSLFGLEIQAG